MVLYISERRNLISSHSLVDIWRELYKAEEVEVMFINTDFLKNDDVISLIKVKNVSANKVMQFRESFLKEGETSIIYFIIV